MTGSVFYTFMFACFTSWYVHVYMILRHLKDEVPKLGQICRSARTTSCIWNIYQINLLSSLHINDYEISTYFKYFWWKLYFKLSHWVKIRYMWLTEQRLIFVNNHNQIIYMSNTVISKLPVTWHKVYDINEYIIIRRNTIPIKQTAHPGFSLKLEEVHDFRYMKK